LNIEAVEKKRTDMHTQNDTIPNQINFLCDFFKLYSILNTLIKVERTFMVLCFWVGGE